MTSYEFQSLVVHCPMVPLAEVWDGCKTWLPRLLGGKSQRWLPMGGLHFIVESNCCLLPSFVPSCPCRAFPCADSVPFPCAGSAPSLLPSFRPTFLPSFPCRAVPTPRAGSALFPCAGSALFLFPGSVPLFPCAGSALFPCEGVLRLSFAQVPHPSVARDPRPSLAWDPHPSLARPINVMVAHTPPARGSGTAKKEQRAAEQSILTNTRGLVYFG